METELIVEALNNIAFAIRIFAIVFATDMVALIIVMISTAIQIKKTYR